MCLGILSLFACARQRQAKVTPEELRAHVAYLASDELAGRATGTPGIAKAEEYIADHFAAVGLRPLPSGDSFFVDYTIFSRSHTSEGTLLEVVAGDGPPVAGEAGIDFRPFPFSDQGYVEGELVFAGYGITAEKYDHDDYAGLDVVGKVVLILRYEPNEQDPESVFDGASMTSHAYFATKAENAEAHGAAGMLLFTTPLHHSSDEDLRLQHTYRLSPEELEMRPPGSDRNTFLAAQISMDFAQSIVAPAGATIADLQRAVDQGRSPADFDLHPLHLRMGIHLGEELQQTEARNVVGYLEGEQTDEVIVIGAHHDHLGSFAGAGDTIFNGADDNASGVAAVLELAEAFALRRSKPPRSMVFATFSGEEWYLLGSSAMVRHSQVPVESIAFMLNLDMIGRNPRQPIQVYGTSSSPGLGSLLERSNAETNLPLKIHTQPSMGSDHDAFRRKGIPYLFFFTDTHDDYHGVDDEADRLDYQRMASIAKLAERVLYSIDLQ